MQSGQGQGLQGSPLDLTGKRALGQEEGLYLMDKTNLITEPVFFFPLAARKFRNNLGAHLENFYALIFLGFLGLFNPHFPSVGMQRRGGSGLWTRLPGPRSWLYPLPFAQHPHFAKN